MAVDLIRARDEIETWVEERASELLKMNEQLKQESAEHNQAEENLRRCEGNKNARPIRLVQPVTFYT